MTNSPPRPSPRRWIVLMAVAIVNAVVQFFWLCYAAVSRLSQEYFHVSGWNIGVLSMLFMAAYVFVGIPAAWGIDRWGHRTMVGLGVLVTGLAGMARGLAGDDFTWVLVATVPLAIAQPLVVNAWMILVHHWFPKNERITVLSWLTGASLVGILLGLIVPASMVTPLTLYRLSHIQVWAGLAGVVVAIVFWIVVQERPDGRQLDAGEAPRLLSMRGVRHALKIREFRRSLIGMFLGMGAFTGVLQWMAEILMPFGFDGLTSALLSGGLLALGALSGLIVGRLADKSGREVAFFVAGFFVAAVGCFVLAYALEFVDLVIGAAFVGVGLISLMPIMLSYTAKVVFPTSESTTNGLVQLAAQSSVAYVGVMYVMKTNEGLYWMALLLTGVMLLAWGIFMATQPEALDVVRERQRQETASESAPGEPLGWPVPRTPL